MNFSFFNVFGRFWFPFSGFLFPEWYLLQATRDLRELCWNSSGDSGEMGEAGAPRTLPSTRAWGQDDGSSHKLPQITHQTDLHVATATIHFHIEKILVGR